MLRWLKGDIIQRISFHTWSSKLSNEAQLFYSFCALVVDFEVAIDCETLRRTTDFGVELKEVCCSSSSFPLDEDNFPPLLLLCGVLEAELLETTSSIFEFVDELRERGVRVEAVFPIGATVSPPSTTFFRPDRVVTVVEDATKLLSFEGVCCTETPASFRRFNRAGVRLNSRFSVVTMAAL